MGAIFEELLRRFNEENNEEAGEHFTPRDAISLLARLIFEPVKDNLPKIIFRHDPAEASGGMLTEGCEYLLGLGARPGSIQLTGTKINPETRPVIKKVHKSSSADVDELMQVYGVEATRLPDYGYAPSP